MILNKYSEIKQNSTTIGSYSAKKSNSSSSGSSSTNKSVGLDRIIWGQDDDGGDLDGDLTCGGNIYIVDNYDENEDDENEDTDNYSGASRKQEPIMPLSIAEDLQDKFDNEEGGNLYVKRQLVVDKNTYSKEIYLDYPQVKEDNSNKVNLLELLKMIIPKGSIIMHNGSETKENLLKYGWAICDGSNGTPNLKDKFIKAVTSTSDVGATGGSSSVTLTTDNMPSHSHTATTTVNLTKSSDTEPTVPNRLNNQKIITYGETFYQAFDLGGDKHYTAETGYESAQDKGIEEVTVNDLVDIANSGTNGGYSASATTTIGNSGNGTAFNIEPPYYSLIYIMRIS